MMTADIPAEALAEEFCRILREWLPLEELAKINRRNSTPEYSACCASHDFCAPNQAMIDAISIFGLECHSSMCDYLNDLWAIARNSGFGDIPIRSHSH